MFPRTVVPHQHNGSYVTIPRLQISHSHSSRLADATDRPSLARPQAGADFYISLSLQAPTRTFNQDYTLPILDHTPPPKMRVPPAIKGRAPRSRALLGVKDAAGRRPR
ncbi:hypothetical protein J6590_044125 [Homalodisca vitripennis]|nr:hypothetical protein J6590_044125 [Homalodisca vitripennis]